MATKFYLNAATAPYTPATFRGAWDDTSSAVTKYLSLDKVDSGIITNNFVTETSATLDWDMLFYRGVSAPLSTQTINGTVDVVLGAFQSTLASHMCFHIHIYVTQGDSDTPRGTLLTDYTELVANELGTASATSGRSLAAAQTLSSLAVTAGDRLVVEIGYVARNSVTTLFGGTLYYGGGTSLTDLAVGGSGPSNPGFITFSATITEIDQPAKISQILAEGAVTQTAATNAQISQILMEGALSATAATNAQISQLLVEIPIFNYVASTPRNQIIIIG